VTLSVIRRHCHCRR